MFGPNGGVIGRNRLSLREQLQGQVNRPALAGQHSAAAQFLRVIYGHLLPKSYLCRVTQILAGGAARVTQTAYNFGPVKLADGVRPKHAVFFLISAFLGICLTTFLSTFLPYLMAVNLQLPQEQQGQVSG